MWPAEPLVAPTARSLLLVRPPTRRSIEQVTAALDAERGLTDADRAAVRVAHALGNVPTTIDDDARADLRRHFSVKDGSGWCSRSP